ncbi:MAG: TlpA disulfide reductase family protein, partial [Sediminibacterium sp.]
KISEKELLKYISKIPIERKDGNKIIVDTASILVVLGGKKNLLFTMAEYATANLIIDKKSYQLLAYSNSFLGVSYLKTQMVVWADSMRTKKVSDDVLVNDSGFVFLNKQMFRYNGIDIIKKELILEKVDERNYVSPQIGFYAPAISGTDVLSGTGLVLEAFKGKYVFIDFWGTWCGPCIEELPTLKQVFQKIDKNRVQMLSVATSDNVLNLKKFLKKIAIKWPQILSDETAERYSINAYPTNFLVDPKGKIIAKNLHVKDLLREINELTARED